MFYSIKIKPLLLRIEQKKLTISFQMVQPVLEIVPFVVANLLLV